jgi:hypothetical protein
MCLLLKPTGRRRFFILGFINYYHRETPLYILYVIIGYIYVVVLADYREFIRTKVQQRN